MSDLISREALKEDFKSRLADCNGWIENAKDKETKIRASAVKAFICEVIMTIDNAPTVEPTFGLFKEMLCSECDKRPQGEWIMDNEHTKNPLLWYKCNLCGVYHSPTNFCPNCGAEMKGGTE